MAQFGPFCTDFRVVTKRCETAQNMSFGSNGVDRVHSLRKIPMQVALSNWCLNSTGSARFAPTFVQ
jgi:hypothetical protein